MVIAIGLLAVDRCLSATLVYLSKRLMIIVKLLSVSGSPISMLLGVSHASHPNGTGVPAFSNFGVLLYLCTYSLRRRRTEFGVEHMWVDVCFRGQPRHCLLHNVSRGLSAIAEFLVDFHGSYKDASTSFRRATTVIRYTAYLFRLLHCGLNK